RIGYLANILATHSTLLLPSPWKRRTFGTVLSRTPDSQPIGVFSQLRAQYLSTSVQAGHDRPYRDRQQRGYLFVSQLLDIGQQHYLLIVFWQAVEGLQHFFVGHPFCRRRLKPPRLSDLLLDVLYDAKPRPRATPLVLCMVHDRYEPGPAVRSSVIAMERP